MKQNRVPILVLIVGLALLVAGLAVVSGDASASPTPSDAALIQQLRQVTGGRVRISFHSQTNRVRFVGTDLGHPITFGGGATGAGPEAAARVFLTQYGSLFGVTDPSRELAVTEKKTVGDGRSFVRFQQTHQGLDVFGAELIVQLDASGNVISANGEFARILSLNVVPAIDAARAQASAIDVLSKSYGLSASQWHASAPQLQIYNPVLLKPGRNHNALVWVTEISSATRADIRELVLVDAQLGVVAQRIPEIHTAKDRQIYDNNNDSTAGLPGTGPVRTEGDPPSAVAEVNFAYDFLGDTYDFYFNQHGRDGLDDAGMTMIATVRYCPDAISCPYANAFWDGVRMQMVFGDGYASGDDVVGHELTHGVTDFESHLFYAYQSGAINEAFSDIWGEWIDLTNGAGDDSSGVRWLMGEDLPIGAIRSMSNPPAYGDPDRITSGNYLCTEFTNAGDWGGVHTNSGVANKAAYLLTDGDTFNGYTISGLGITKTAQIFYEVQTNLFTSAGDYQDLHDTLYQGCTNLIGTAGITAADCTEVREATLATEMNVVACAADDPPMCPTGQAPGTYFFADDLEVGGNWTSSALAGANEWYYPPQPGSNPYGFDAEWATSGSRNFWGFDTDVSNSDYVMAMNADAAIASGSSPYMYFSHAHIFERTAAPPRNWDGGVVEYSTNGGSSWLDAGSLFLDNGYNGTIYSGTANPLAGRSGFVHESAGYQSSRLDLSSLAGGNARFRFRIGVDALAWDYGWFIDDVYLYHCGGVDYSDSSHSGYGDSGHAEPLGGFTVWLGTEVGTESGPSVDTNDGVTRSVSPWSAGNPTSVDVDVSGGSGYLAGWFDWNADGVFGPGEQAIGQNVISGSQTVNFTAGTAFDPAANPTLNARFRLYESEPTSLVNPLAPSATETPANIVPDGEVEDYSWSFSPTAITFGEASARASSAWPGWTGALFMVLATASLATLVRKRR